MVGRMTFNDWKDEHSYIYTLTEKGKKTRE